MAKQKEEILFEWMCPKEVPIAAAKGCLRRWKVFLPKVFLIIIVIWTSLYFALNYLLPQDSDINLKKPFISGFLTVVGLLFFICVADYLSHIFSKTKYQITSSRIGIVGARFIRWKDIIGYEIIKDKGFEVSWVGIFFDKGRFYRLICLPRDDRSGQIVKYIAERVPLLEKIPESLEIVKLSVKEKIWLCVITAIYSLGLSVFIAFYGHKWVWLIWAVPFLGPGTIYLASVYKRRFFINKSIQSCAIIFNVISFMLIVLLASWVFFWQMKKEYGW
jgi:hypothetical protein